MGYEPSQTGTYARTTGGFLGQAYPSYRARHPADEAGAVLDLRSVDVEEPTTTSEYVRQQRLAAGLSVEELAARVRVEPTWLAAFEDGSRTEELSYELLLELVRATQPTRPEWWDSGHEHDLHLGPNPTPPGQEPRPTGYWSRIARVRAANRTARVQP